jgi:hypothetical protein
MKRFQSTALLLDWMSLDIKTAYYILVCWASRKKAQDKLFYLVSFDA